MSSAKHPQSPIPFLQLIRYMRPHKARAFLAALCTMLSTIFDLLPDLLIGVAVDVVIKQEQSYLARFGIMDVKMQIVALGIAACIIWMLEAIFEYCYGFLWRNLAQTVQHDLRTNVYEHMQQLGVAYYEEANTGTLLSILNDDINQLERFLDVGIYKFIYLATTTVAVGAIFLYLAPSVALYALFPMPIIVLTVSFFKKRLAPRYVIVRQKVSALANRITNNIMGITTIKSYTAEDFELERLRSDSAQYKQANSIAITLSAAFMPIVRMIIVVAFTATVILGGWQVLEGLLDVGAYSILVFQTQRLLWPVTELAEMTDLYERAMASVRRVFGLLTTPISTQDGTLSMSVESIHGTITFDQVSFSYQQGTSVFNAISYSIKPGDTVAFVGATGSGKSTLIKLLLRFYDVDTGAIYIDGVNIKEMRIKDLRKAISFVSQDVFLFHGTVKDNIRYGSFNASMDEIVRAARIAQAHDFIMQLPQGYDTIIGERGQTLSGGQRQRISIARAVVKNAPIMVFDEATSAIDNQTESAILRAVEKNTVQKTVIMIAHRLSTICNADMIFVLDQGTIVESGTHDELVAHNGVYAMLWRVQTGDIPYESYVSSNNKTPDLPTMPS